MKKLTLIVTILFNVNLFAANAERPLCFPNVINCSYYDCLEDDFQCGQEGYMQAYGKHYCERFTEKFIEFAPILSLDSQLWRTKTMYCLQKALKAELNLEMTCLQVREEGFRNHPICYTNHDKSICFLPLKDVGIIMGKVLDPKELVFDKLSRKQVVQTAKICVKQISEKDPRSSERLEFWKRLHRQL